LERKGWSACCHNNYHKGDHGLPPKEGKRRQKRKKKTSTDPFPLKKRDDNLKVQNFQHILNQ